MCLWRWSVLFCLLGVVQKTELTADTKLVEPRPLQSPKLANSRWRYLLLPYQVHVVITGCAGLQSMYRYISAGTEDVSYSQLSTTVTTDVLVSSSYNLIGPWIKKLAPRRRSFNPDITTRHYFLGHIVKQKVKHGLSGVRFQSIYLLGAKGVISEVGRFRWRPFSANITHPLTLLYRHCSKNLQLGLFFQKPSTDV